MRYEVFTLASTWLHTSLPLCRTWQALLAASPPPPYQEALALRLRLALKRAAVQEGLLWKKKEESAVQEGLLWKKTRKPAVQEGLL